MTETNIADRLAEMAPGILPEKIAEQAKDIHAQMSARELARIKLRARKAELDEAKKLEEREALAEKHNMLVEELGPNDTDESLMAKERAQEAKALETAIDKQSPVDPLDVSEVQVVTKTGETMSGQQLLTLQTLQGTNRPEMAKLMSQLGINLSVRLSKTDTSNLLACLLTCNETQLDALLANNKMPLALKAIIRRIKIEAKEGQTGTIERLWDRLFGKGPMSLDATPVTGVPSAVPGLIPDQPISREAYIIIRDTLLK